MLQVRVTIEVYEDDQQITKTEFLAKLDETNKRHGEEAIAVYLAELNHGVQKVAFEKLVGSDITITNTPST